MLRDRGSNKTVGTFQRQQKGKCGQPENSQARCALCSVRSQTQPGKSLINSWLSREFKQDKLISTSRLSFCQSVLHRVQQHFITLHTIHSPSTSNIKVFTAIRDARHQLTTFLVIRVHDIVGLGRISGAGPLPQACHTFPSVNLMAPSSANSGLYTLRLGDE